MTIKELIAELQKHDENLDVAFWWDSGLSHPGNPEVTEQHGTKVLTFDVSSYGSWDWDHEKPKCICAGRTEETHKFDCPLFGESRKCTCLGFTHTNACPQFVLPL